MGIFDSPREREAKDIDEAARKKGVDSSSMKPCPDDCNRGYRGGFRCRTCGGEGAVKR